MKKNFLLLICLLMGLNISAQIAETFIPDPNEVYYIKCSDTGKGNRNTAFLIEDQTTHNLINQVISSTDVISEPMAQWNIFYDAAKGYSIKNKESGNFFKYGGVWHATNGISAQEMIDPSEAGFYFELRKGTNPIKIGNAALSFSAPGYLMIAIGSENNQCLDVFSPEGEMGTWDYESLTKTNHIFMILKASDLPTFEAALISANQPFIPQVGKSYYIKNESAARGLLTSFLTQNADTIAIQKMTDREATLNDNAKWEVVYVDAQSAYTLKNVGTGMYLKFTGDLAGTIESARGANMIAPRSSVDGEGGFLFKFQSTRPDYFLGIEGNTQIPSFTAPVYHLTVLGSTGPQALDAYSAVQTGTYDTKPTDPIQSWMFIQDEDLALFSQAKAGSDFSLDLDPDMKYTIRPNNYWVQPPGITNPTEEQIAEFELTARNCRIADLNGELHPVLYDADDETQQWQIVKDETSGQYWFMNVGTTTYLTINKWENPTNWGELSELGKRDFAANYVVMDALDTQSISQQLEIGFVKWITDEYGKSTKVVAIANNANAKIPFSSYLERRYFLDGWHNGNIYAESGRIACFVDWNGGASGAAQQFVIRTVVEDQATSVKTEKAQSTTKVIGLKNEIVVTTSAKATISVYTVGGALVKHTTDKNITVAPGFYLVKVGTEAFKVAVK